MSFTPRTFAIVPQDDEPGYEIQIDPALPDGTALAIKPTYEEASEWALGMARKHGGGISQVRSYRRQ